MIFQRVGFLQLILLYVLRTKIQLSSNTSIAILIKIDEQYARHTLFIIYFLCQIQYMK